MADPDRISKRISFPGIKEEEEEPTGGPSHEKKTPLSRFRSSSDANRVLNRRSGGSFRSRPKSLVRTDSDTDRFPSLSGKNRADSTLKSLIGLKDRGTVQVTRPIWTHVQFDEIHGSPDHQENRPIIDSVKCECSAYCTKSFFQSLFPFVGIMRKYKWKEWVTGDLVAGLTVGIMNLPQGMAYALLANVPPIYGLYVSFFPTLVYFFFGTSRHCAVGTFAVVSLMAGEIVNQEMSRFVPSKSMADSMVNGTIVNDTIFSNASTPVPMKDMGKLSHDEIKFRVGVATAVALLTGIFQLLMGVFRLGFVTIYLGDPLISGFTTGAACHVLTSQVKYVFGLKIQSFSGPFKIPKTFKEIFINIADTNPATVIMAIICIGFLILVKEVINPQVKKKCKYPVPVELIVVVIGTMVSYLGKMEDSYNVLTVGEIPTGIPAPSLPDESSILNVIGDCFAIAVVSFAIAVSMGKLLAQKHNYEILPNQELIAFGLCNIISSFFNCFPCCASLSRSLVQENVGGRTQLAAVFSCVLVLIVLLAIGPLFESLPNAVLASIIVVALKGMFLQFKELKRLWSICKYDFAIWLITWLAVVLLTVDLGLAIGVGFSLLTVVFRTQSPYVGLHGRVPHTDIYRDTSSYKTARQITGIKIINFLSSLYYANAEHFRTKVFSLTVNPLKIKANRQKVEERNMAMRKTIAKKATQNGDIEKNTEHEDIEMKDQKLLNGYGIRKPHQNGDTTAATSPESEKMLRRQSSSSVTEVNFHHLIIDCSTMSYIDSVGVKVLSQVIKEFKDVGVNVFLSNCRGTVRQMLDRSGFYDNIPREILYLTIHDAVLAALNKHEVVKSEFADLYIVHDDNLVEEDIKVLKTRHLSLMLPSTPPVIRMANSNNYNSTDTMNTIDTIEETDIQSAPLEDDADETFLEEVDV